MKMGPQTQKYAVLGDLMVENVFRRQFWEKSIGRFSNLAKKGATTVDP